MPDSKITALTSIGTGTDPANDPLVIVDVSDVSPGGMSATGTTKKVTLNNLLACSPTATLASATITGDLTVDTSTLKVDSTNNRVIVGHTSGSSAFQVTNAGAAGLEIQPTGFSSSPLILSYNRSGSAYTQLTLDGSTIVHALSGTTAMTLNSTGLGVGVTPSAGRLHIKGGASQSPLVLDTLGYNQIVLQLNGANRGQIYADATNCLALVDSTGSNLRLVVTDTGNVGVGVVPSGSGGCLQLKSGITFPATQVASSDANTLDDYEEGTWTGTLTGSTTNPTVPVTATGRYTKIGRQVYVQIIFGSVNTTGASGAVSITGLPFANNASTASQGSILSDNALTFTGSPFVFVDASTSTLLIYQSTSNAAASACTHNAGTARYLYANLTYSV